MEYQISNLRAEKAIDGKIYVVFTDTHLSPYGICIAQVQGKQIKYQTAEGANRVAII